MNWKPRILNFLRSRWKLLSFLGALILIYKSIFNPYSGQWILDTALPKIFHGSSQVRVEKFSLFFGFKFRNLKLGDTLPDYSPLFECDEMELSYNLPSLILGKVSVGPVSLKNPKISIWDDKNGSNLNRILGPSRKSGKKSVSSTEKSSSDAISTYIPIKAEVQAKIENLSFLIRKTESKSDYLYSIENFDWKFSLITHRFSEIPLSLSALEILDSLEIQLNPNKDLNVQIANSGVKARGPIQLKLLIEKNRDGNGDFSSEMDWDTKGLPVLFTNGGKTDLNLTAKYNLQYLDQEQKIRLDNLVVAFKNNVWLAGKGKADLKSQKEDSIQFEMIQSDIEFAPIGRLLSEFPGMQRMTMHGSAHLLPFSVHGNRKNFFARGTLELDDFILRMSGQSHEIPRLDMQINSELSLEDGKSGSLGPLRSIDLDKLSLIYNGLEADVNGKVDAEGPSRIEISTKKILLSRFVQGIGGILSTDFVISGPDLQHLSIQGGALLRSLGFRMGRSYSGLSDWKFSLQSRLSAAFGLQYDRVFLDRIRIVGRNEKRELVFESDVFGNIQLKPVLRVQLDETKFRPHLKNLSGILPLPIRSSVANLSNLMGDEPNIKTDLVFVNEEEQKQVSGKLAVSLPGLDIRDLELDWLTNVTNQGGMKIQLQNVGIHAFQKKLQGKITGALEESDPRQASLGPFRPDLKVDLSLASSVAANLWKDSQYRGDLRIGMKIQDNWVRGNLDASNVTLRISNGSCPGPDCKLYQIEDLEMNLPIQHDLKFNIQRDLVSGSTTPFLSAYGPAARPNFTIRQIIGTHPAIKGAPFYYIKGEGNKPGLEARIDYRENYLAIPQLRIRLLDGFVYGKNVLFDIGAANPENMAYMGTIQVKDIDLKQLLPKRKQGIVDDGKIRADLNVSGHDLSQPLENLNLFFSVYKIGRDFGVSALNVISPQNILTDAIINSYAVDKIDIQLSKGLVYADVLFERSLLSSLIHLENNRLSQQRMPLANFLNRAKSEIQTYQ